MSDRNTVAEFFGTWGDIWFELGRAAGKGALYVVVIVLGVSIALAPVHTLAYLEWGALPWKLVGDGRGLPLRWILPQVVWLLVLGTGAIAAVETFGSESE